MKVRESIKNSMYMNESKNHSSQRYRMNHRIQAYSEISEVIQLYEIVII